MIISDYGVAVLGSHISAIVAAEAPRARLRLSAPTPYVVDRAAQVLLSTDLLVLPHGFVSELRHRDLYRDDWMCLVSEDNDEVGDKITVDHLAELPWVASYHGPTASTAGALSMRMLGDRAARPGRHGELPHRARAGRGLRPRRTHPAPPAGAHPPALGIRALPCPIEVTPLVEAMWWHPARRRSRARIPTRRRGARMRRGRGRLDGGAHRRGPSTGRIGRYPHEASHFMLFFSIEREETSDEPGPPAPRQRRPPSPLPEASARLFLLLAAAPLVVPSLRHQR